MNALNTLTLSELTALGILTMDHAGKFIVDPLNMLENLRAKTIRRVTMGSRELVALWNPTQRNLLVMRDDVFAAADPSGTRSPVALLAGALRTETLGGTRPGRGDLMITTAQFGAVDGWPQPLDVLMPFAQAVLTSDADGLDADVEIVTVQSYEATTALNRLASLRKRALNTDAAQVAAFGQRAGEAFAADLRAGVFDVIGGTEELEDARRIFRADVSNGQ